MPDTTSGFPNNLSSPNPPPNRRKTAPSSEVPFVEWPQVWDVLTDEETGFRQGDHVAIIGPTGTGKTHIALELAELRDWKLFVACKPEDEIISELVGFGYHVVGKLDIPYVERPPGSGRYVPAYSRVVFWPRLPQETLRRLRPEAILEAEKRLQKPAVGGAIGYVRKNGRWCLILDEATWVCRDLNLQRDVDSALFQFRSLGASLILCGQRPSWMGRYALSMPTHLFIFQTAHKDDIKSLGDISGVNYESVIQTVPNLDHLRHEVLYVNTRTRGMFRTIAPAR